MTTKELQKYIGKEYILPIKGIRIPVKVVDVKENWGRVILEVEPTSGEGSAWFERGSLFDPQDK